MSLVNEDTINFNFLLNTSDVPGKLLNLILEKYFVYGISTKTAIQIKTLEAIYYNISISIFQMES